MSKTEITPEKVERWKKEHGRVFIAKCEGKAAYYRKPTRKDLSYAMTLKGQPLDMYETLLRSCFLGGEPLHDDPDALLGCAPLAEKMIEVKSVEVGEA